MHTTKLYTVKYIAAAGIDYVQPAKVDKGRRLHNSCLLKVTSGNVRDSVGWGGINRLTELAFISSLLLITICSVLSRSIILKVAPETINIKILTFFFFLAFKVGTYWRHFCWTLCSQWDQISWNSLYFELGVGAGKGGRLFRLFLLFLQHLEAIDPTFCLEYTHA